MANPETVVRSGGMRRALDKALLGGVSLLALMTVSDLGHARVLIPGDNTVAATSAVQQAAIAAAQQSASAAAQAQASLARAAAALASARKLQLDAAAAARAQSSSVPNGLTTGGLMPVGGTAGDPLAGIKADRTKWIGADLPTQTTSGNEVKVNINQTQQKGIFYWNTFNVGANTTVNFNQATSEWIALNRVIDPTAAPSRILGQINALGSVYVINRNGIIFGAGSQVNVHSLVASSLDIGPLRTDRAGRDQYFLNTGIANLNSFSIYEEAGETNLVAGDIKVDRGASIVARINKDVSPLGSPGWVYLFGANVTNSGSISTPTGEVAMVAARTIDLIPNGYSALPKSVLGTDSAGDVLKFRGTEFTISHFASSYDANGYPRVSNYLAGTGAVTHDGLIDASRGAVIMNGDRISVDNPKDASGDSLKDAAGNLIQGVISVDSSIERNSVVLLRAATSVSMNGVISSLPFDDGATLPSGTGSGNSVQSFTPAYIEMSAQSTTTVGSSGLISAPSAQVVIRAIDLGKASGVYKETGRSSSDDPIYKNSLFNQGGNIDVSSNTLNASQSVLLAPGATIDVAGLQNVELPASYNFIAIKPSAEFADMPLQRPPYAVVAADGTGAVYNQTLWIDIRASGTRSDGTRWVGTPLADASGYVSNVGRSINQLMTVGGNVELRTNLGTNNGGSGVQTAGSVINLAGGSVKFLPGMVNTTRLLGADGRIYSMANADPNRSYLGIAGQFTRNHARWGVTETWSTGTQVYSPGYTEGHDAGGVMITTVSPVLAGMMYFGSTAGERQINAGLLPLQGSLALTTPSSVQIGTAPSANYTTQSAVKTILSADVLSGYGLSALSITANDLVVSSGSTLNLAPGGSFSVATGGAIDIAGTVSATGGAINLVTDRGKATAKDSKSYFGAGSDWFKAPVDQTGAVIAANVFVGGTLDVSGRFVNDTGRTGTDMSGPAFTDGGTISITTNKDSADGRDLTGSILLAQSGVLDVSSGGYVSAQGKPKTASTGVLAGKAGGISLAIYKGVPWRPPEESAPPVRPTPAVSQVAVLQLDGSLLGYGFENNGSLRLASANTIRIGGTLQPGETSAIRINGAASTLPESLLTGGGFGAYTIESVTDDWSGATANIIVSAGTSLTLRQQNLSSLADYRGTATGTRLGQQHTPLALLADDQRKPVDLTLRADNILLDTGSVIVTDPKASITFGGLNADRTLKLSDPTRNAPAENVVLRGSIIDHGGTVFINAKKTHLGSQAVVDLSGTFVANSRFGTVNGPVTSGTYLAGGTFAVEAGTITSVMTYKDPKTPEKNIFYYAYDMPGAGYLVADAGALLDVSGSAGAIQIADARGVRSSVWAWSDAGTMSADVSGFAWGGGFAATGGRYTGSDGTTRADARANAGTMILGGGAISLRQDSTDVNAHLSSPQSIYIAADQLAPFDNVFLYSGAAKGGAARFFEELPENIYNSPINSSNFKPLTISGSLNWHVASGLRIAAGTIGSDTAGSAVTLDAPYVMLTSIGSTTLAGTSTFNVRSQTIDVAGANFAGFAQVNLISSGDIRLTTPKVSNTIDPNTGALTYPDNFTGKLESMGDLFLQAQRIYPVSAVNFTIQTPGNVTFAAPSGSNTAIPLSAGGGLTVIAKTIEQGGNLFAPLGKITLGNTNPNVSAIATESVTLKPGSLTSVTLADMVVPYGATSDGTNWYYNSALNPLSRPPSKGIELAGANVTRSDGSTIDLRGGGDLQAFEWIQGKGGSRDTLTTTPSGQTVYALVPSQRDPVSAFDIRFTAARSDGGKTVTAGDVYPLVGTQITLDGGNGVPAGTYTLYPAHYATLPGAMRVTYYGDNTGRNIPTGATLPDGTVVVTGHTTQSTAPGKQSSGQTLFAVQSNAVWRQYSEYSFNRANSYFVQKAAKRNLTVARLPMDAGRLAVSALQSIVLNGIALTQPGQDDSGNIGRGGELDISAPKLAVVGHAQYVANDIPAGYVGLDVAQLTGFESILIGGKRSDFSSGTVITPTASNVVVDTRGDTFVAPEILMVAQQVGEWQEVKQWLTVGSDPNNSVLVNFPIYQPLAGSGSVTVNAGSIIETKGTVHAGFGRNYIVASDGQAPVTAASLAAALGGTLSGTEIINAKLTNLPASWFGSGFQSPAHIVPNSANQAIISYYANGGAQQPGRGALFAASNDPTLVLTGPTATGGLASALTIKFANVTPEDAAKLSSLPGAPAGPVPTGQVTGILTLPGGDTANNGQVSIAAGARISTNTLTLQGTAKNNAITIKTNDLHAEQVNLTAPTIGIGASMPVADKGLVLATNTGQFADVRAMTLKALSGPVTVYGDFNPGLSRLTLDASGIKLGAEVLSPGASLSLRADALVVFPQAATVQFSVGVTVTSVGGTVTTYAANTTIALEANSKVSLASAGTVTASGPDAVGLLRDSTIVASDNVTLKNTGGPAFTGGTAGNGNTLALVAKQIELGGGSQTITGFSQVNWTASDRVLISGPGTMSLGIDGNDRVNLAVKTPSILVAAATAANSKSFALTSFAGNISVVDSVARSAAVDRPTASAEIGGSLEMTASNITIASTLQAQAGTIALNATAGNLTLDTGAYIAAGGYKHRLVDVDTYVAGGKVVLYADIGTALPPLGGGQVITMAGSVVDVAQVVDPAFPAKGLQGYGGEINVTALRGGVTLAGSFRGEGGPGLGGRFKLDSKGKADLTALADNLLAGGITGSIDIHTRTGNLDLAAGHTLKANVVTLTADDSTWDNADTSKQFGQVIIRGTVDADGYAGKTANGSGQAGGQVGLFGHNAVVLTGTGRILARSTHADERGGDVMIGTAWSAASYIDLQSGSSIDVSGGTKGGLSGGTVTLRAPLDGNNDVRIKNLDATITGARAVNIQGFVTINTEASPNNVNGINGSSLTTRNGIKAVWDGYVDPAGSTNSDGVLIDYGPWTNVTGQKLNVTPGSGYTAAPTISVLSGGTTIVGTAYVDSATGETFYAVTDPLTGTTFRSSLQVASISLSNGGIYTGAPTVTVTAANGKELPSWGGKAVATAVMKYNDISIANVAVADSFNGRTMQLLDGSGAVLAQGTAVVQNGMLIKVTVTSGTSGGGNLQSIRFGGFGTRPPDVTSDHFSSVTLSVAAVTIAAGGSGYSGAVSVSFSGGNPSAVATATATMGSAVTITEVSKGYAGANLPSLTITANGGGSGAGASFANQTTGFSGTSGSNHVFMPSLGDFIPSASSKVFNGTGDSAVVTIAPNLDHQLLYSDVLAGFVQGNGIQGVGLSGNFGFSGLFDRLQNGLVKQLGADVVHVQPGIELVNTSAARNSGNITVTSNWNLAAGTAGNLQTVNSTTYFDPATSYVNFNYRLATPWGGLDAGALTLRAVGNININASISDGFFQFGNYRDTAYMQEVASYITAKIYNRTIDPAQSGLYTYYLNKISGSAVPIAPYKSSGNAISPTAEDLAVADLFPHSLRVCTIDCNGANIKPVTALSSWSYFFTAGADVSSANPMARSPLASAQAVDRGDVIVDKHTSYDQPLVADIGAISRVTVNLPTLVRTGTGNIAIAAARNVILKDTVAPGVIYAAGVNTAKLVDPNYSLQTVDGASRVVVGNADGFFEPKVLAYGSNAADLNAPELYYGPANAAAFPERGGDVRIDAQQDIVGYSGDGNKVLQYYQPWLLSNTGIAPANSALAATSSKLFGAGVFAPLGSEIASQTAWWIQYGSFQQGILSAGGNATLIAGRDLIDVSVSLPTTGRVSGGLSANSMPVKHVYGGGNMDVRAGRNILGGSFYEGSGHATITAGGSIGQNGTVSRFKSSLIQLADVPLLAVDTGQITMAARGSIDIAGVVNPAELHAQQPSFANPLESGGPANDPLYMDTYGPDSKVRLVAQAGDLTIAIAPTAITDQSGGRALRATAAMYPASFEALALNGSLITKGIQVKNGAGAWVTIDKVRGTIPMPGIVLSPSVNGTFKLLARDNVDLSFGYPSNTTFIDGVPRPFISAGPSLIETAFDPFRPNSGFDGAFNGAVLAHKEETTDDAVALIYAATGDIKATGSYGQVAVNGSTANYQRIEINRPTKVYAGRDIVDLNIIVQNNRTSDVSRIEAERDISYTGYNNGGGLQVAGPGFLVVQAGGDIGPFLPAAHNNGSEAAVQEGIASVGNSSNIPVGNFNISGRFTGGGSVGIYNQSLLGPASSPRRNALLTEAAGARQGADIITVFGAKFGVDRQAVITAYIDPDNATKVDHNYLAELQTFLARVGKPASASDAKTVFAAFKDLPTDLQHVFVDQVFFAELKAVGMAQQGESGQFQRGYQMINTMFPSSLGYTANALGGGTNGANQLVKTGDLNLLHATIQTRLGGDISLFGPGGNLIVGSLAAESNPNLKLRDLGVLTLGGGNINSFTDGSAIVNSSRVLTTQGGDVLMWSSNGDLDAGRGSKTTLSAPALQVQFDQDDYQSVDLGGFVTGAGIGTLQASTAAKKSNLYLLAPRGKIDAGTAGIRVSGNAVFVAPVVANATNIQVQGNSSGIPSVSVGNIGALTSGSNTAGASTRSAEAPTASGNRDRASVFMVEVVGYGGGDGQSTPPASDEEKKSSDERKP